MALSDSELIHQINNGNEKAFTELIERYQNKVYNTAYRILETMKMPWIWPRNPLSGFIKI